jgi:hypothetical protein
MGSIGSFEAKTHLPALLERVVQANASPLRKGAFLSPCSCLIENAPLIDRKRAIAELKAFGRDRGRELPEGMTVRDLIDAGRRF